MRFIVGIKMHTQGMTVDEATKLFETQAYQPHPVAVRKRSAARRTRSTVLHAGQAHDPQAAGGLQGKLGPEYSLQRFHDEFIKLGRSRCRRSGGVIGRDGHAFVSSACSGKPDA